MCGLDWLFTRLNNWLWFSGFYGGLFFFLFHFQLLNRREFSLSQVFKTFDKGKTPGYFRILNKGTKEWR